LLRCDASLARKARSTYVDGADGYIPGCVAFSLPVLRRNLHSRRFQRFPASPEPARCAADKERRFPARAASVPGYFISSRDDLIRRNRLSGPARADMQPPVGALAPRRTFSERRGGRLPPTFLDGPTLDAPDCVADDPWNHCADAPCFLAIMFGAAPRVAFWPSPHPRIRWTVASPGRAKCAHRHTHPPPSRVPKCRTKC
jgi:hypothetical protein